MSMTTASKDKLVELQPLTSAEWNQVVLKLRTEAKRRGIPIIRTIQDLELLYYGTTGDNIINTEFGNGLRADDPLLTTTSGAFNTVYGRMLWLQLNMEANAFGILRKQPFLHSGWRLIVARPSASNIVAENGALPDTDKPDFATATHSPVTVAHSFEASEIATLLAKTQDDTIGDPMTELRNFYGKEHPKAINEYLLADFTSLTTGQPTSIDQIISSTNEVTAIGATAGSEDVFGIDKSTTTWAQPYVDYSSSGVDRDLTLDMIRDLLLKTRPYWSKRDGSNCILLTGHDTFDRISRLLQSQQRFVGEKWIRPSVNGIETVASGIEGGFQVVTFNGIPIMVSADVPKDTIDRIYLIDLGHLFIDVLAPTMYFETGVSHGQPFVVNKFADKGVIRTTFELKATHFKAHGKIRDLA